MCTKVLKGIWIARIIAVLQMGGNITSCLGIKDKTGAPEIKLGGISAKTGIKPSAFFYIITS
jgi:hypothetical protein